MSTSTTERVINFTFVPSRGAEKWSEGVQRIVVLGAFLAGLLTVAVAYTVILEVLQVTAEANTYLEANPLANALVMGALIAPSAFIAYLLVKKVELWKNAKVTRLQIADANRLSQVMAENGYTTVEPISANTLHNAVFVDMTTGEEFVSPAGYWASGGNVTIYLRPNN